MSGCGCLALIAVVGVAFLFAPPLVVPLVIAGVLLMVIWKVLMK